ncbi:MAG: sensor domain-containing diguanylate cyclase [Candidatus Atribacteria bacterium]|nr:sensor domain-containing diguanylate cyclase [Candidatus Atribacteria bacterium]
MKNKENRPGDVAPSSSSGQTLRQRAEEITRGKAVQSPENLEAMSPEETRQTLHDLQVHQIELEIQNEELRRAQAELETARARYFDLYDLAPVGYCTLSKPGLIQEANLTAVTLLGVARGALIKQPISRFILKEDQDIYYRHRKQLFETGAPQVCEMRMVKPDGTAFWTRVEAVTAQDANGVPVCRVVLSDITDRKQAEELIHRLASVDDLTGIFNRRVFIETAENEMSRFHRYGKPFTFIMIDLDNFKSVNDRFGHLAGDRVLKDLVHTVAKQIREVDTLGRLGGEEFGILLVETSLTDGLTTARRIQEALHHTPMKLDSGETLTVTASMGLSEVTKEDTSLDSLISRADMALYKAKDLGRDQIEVNT